ncbi:acyltransferase family protein [Alkalicoccobacillus porphyridii]|uniref:Acyltransferase n=1 Tax=Alkalicoccobacillus porphyridii TaxID=2597270 RepID=A0A553ZV58_9BACI|nr:acyltransferase family protein [Alkalicoccobacillus porphyridii]TSB45349.1 acyltransferase [Alkalicoccobacillus porphyridii]
MTVQPKTYYHAIDTFRLLCAIAVVIVHITSQIPSNDMATWGNYYIYRYVLDIGSPFFFMTAGFIIYQKTADLGASYLLSYVKKIFSYYIIFTLFYMGARLLIEVGVASINNESMRTAFLSQINKWSSLGLLNGSIGSFQLYFLVILIYSALFIYLLLRFKCNTATIFGLSLAIYLAQSAGLLTTFNFFEYKSLAFGLLFVSLGYSLSSIKNNIRFRAPLFYVILFGIGYVLNFYYQIGLAWLLLPLFAFSLGAFCIQHPNLGKGSIITRLSSYSLAIYTLHIFVELLILKTVRVLGWQEFYTQPIYYVITIILCVAVPMVIFKPIYQGALWIKRKLLYTSQKPVATINHSKQKLG